MEGFPEEVTFELGNEAGVISPDLHFVRVTFIGCIMDRYQREFWRQTTLSYLIRPGKNLWHLGVGWQ